MTESAFLQDLAMLMAVAGLVSAVFARFRWPKVLGYIFAGVLLSRHTWGGSFLADENSVQTIGQLGVIFLMFTMGLEFSTSDMKRLKSVTLPTAVLDTLVMTWLGYTLGRNVLHWDMVPSLFLGAAICDSSTTMLAKIIDELRWSKRPFVKYVIGTSVCEDIICVGMIALITGVARGKGMSFVSVGVSIGGLLLFFLATIVFGLILVPRLLTSVAKRQDDEALLLTLLGCCFFVTYIAFKLDFSLALGAFLVGILGASSDARRRIHALADPLRSMFAAVFFVSIGLMVNPAACWTHLPEILLITAAVMLGKGANCFLGGIATGETLKTAVQMGFSLAQIGEFAFMVALLYVTCTGDASNPMYQIVVGVSLLTTVLNPLMLRWSEPVGEWVERICPARFRRRLDAWRGFLVRYRTTSNETAARKVVRTALVELAVIGALEATVAIAVSMLAARDWSNLSAFFDRYKQIFFFLIANAFFAALAVPIPRIAESLGNAIGETLVGKSEGRWQQAVRNLVRLIALGLGLGAFFVETLMIEINLAPAENWSKALAFTGLGVVALFGWKFFIKAGHRASSRLTEALAAEDRLSKLPREITFTVPENVVSRLLIGPGSPAVGGTVVSLNIRAKTGASVVSVERAGRIFRNPGPDWEFGIGDVVVAMGDGPQIAALKDLLGITA